jgi:hypothetical protein
LLEKRSLTEVGPESIISLGLSVEDSSKLLVTLEAKMEADRIQDGRGVEGNVAPSTTQPLQFRIRPAPSPPPQILRPLVPLLLPPSLKRQLRLLVPLPQLEQLQLLIGMKRKQLPRLALLRLGGLGSNINL